MVVVNRHVAVGIGALWFFGYLPSRLLSITALLLGLLPLVSGAVPTMHAQKTEKEGNTGSM